MLKSANYGYRLKMLTFDLETGLTIMSVFNLNIQNENTDNKIVAGLERLSTIFRALLWDKAKDMGLSPIQIQILLFSNYHALSLCTVSYIAKEFCVTKPTVSDAVKTLEQKGFITKVSITGDSRSYGISLTETGRQVIHLTENFTSPFNAAIATVTDRDKEILWKNISSLIAALNYAGVINVQRTCTACTHYRYDNVTAFCNLLKQELTTRDIRIDCPEFSPAATG